MIDNQEKVHTNKHTFSNIVNFENEIKGVTLYVHNVHFTFPNYSQLSATIITSAKYKDPFTYDSLALYLYNNGYTGSAGMHYYYHEASGSMAEKSDNTIRIVSGIYASNQKIYTYVNNIKIDFTNSSITTTPTNISISSYEFADDEVTELHIGSSD